MSWRPHERAKLKTRPCIQCRKSFRTPSPRAEQQCPKCRERINAGRHPTEGFDSGQHPKGPHYTPKYLRERDKKDPRAYEQGRMWLPEEWG